MKTRNNLMVISAAFLLLISFVSCKKSTSSDYAYATIKITDAPIDDASVTGAFVTITDIKLDGRSIDGFTKTTIDLAAFQNGSAKTLGNFNLQGKTYSNITFVLDLNTDANGSSPGCYVLTTGNVKHALQTSTNIISVNKSFTLQNSTSSSLVADFDLRKMIRHQSGGGSDHYDFVTDAELQSAVRLVVESQTGIISGALTDAVSGSGKVIVYAYKKGTFNRATEIQAQGSSGIEFKNSVSSAEVKADGSFQLHFLESGDYEIHFASYKDTNSDGEFELKGTLIVTASGGLDLLGITVNSNTTITANVLASGVFGL